MIRLFEKLTQLLGLAAGLTVLLMMFHVMIDVVGKYAFNAPFPGTAEIVANYYMIGCVFLPLAWVEATGGSIVVEIIYDVVPARAQRVMLLLADLVSAAYYAVLAWFSWDVAQRAFRINESVDGIWRITTWPAKFVLPFGFGLVVVILLLRIFLGERARMRVGTSSVDI
jgi:TRAP-type C4-dicarboxylate transport system permease small subunit